MLPSRVISSNGERGGRTTARGSCSGGGCVRLRSASPRYHKTTRDRGNAVPQKRKCRNPVLKMCSGGLRESMSCRKPLRRDGLSRPSLPEPTIFNQGPARPAEWQTHPSALHDAARPDIESPRPKTAAAGRSNSTGVSDGLWDEPVLVQAARNIYFLLLLLIDLCCRLGSALVLLPASLIRAVISPSPPWHCTTPTSLRAHSSQRILRPDTPTSSLGLCVEALFGSASPTVTD